MSGDQDVNYSLMFAVGEGNLEKTREIINSCGLPYLQGYILLCGAVENKHAAVAKLLLMSGSRVNSKSQKPHDSPLHFAAKNGDVEIVKMLLDRGANIHAKNQYGKTPLQYAIQRKAIDVTELLLRHGAYVNAADNRGQTPLHVAVENKAIDVTELCLKHRADVNECDNDGNTPLHVAVQVGCLQIVQQLLNYGAYVNCVCTLRWKKGYAPLHLAVEGGSEELVTLPLSRGAHVDVKEENNGVTPIYIAAERGYMSIAEGLLNHGACIHSLTLREGYTPLHIATKRGHGAVVKLLLQRGAKVDNWDRDGKSILNLAVENGYLMIVEDVLKYCPDVNDQSNKSSLKIAVHGYEEKYKKIVEALQQYGFTVSPEDANNPELLHDAVEKGYLKVIEDLLKYGADVNTYNSRPYDDYRPLHKAAKHKQEEGAKLLINYGADVNAQDKTRKTPIFYAIENADLKFFNLLLSNRANIKDSPELLNFAIEEGCMEIVEALLQRDVDVNASDKYGRTALYYTAISKSKQFYGCLTYEDPDNYINGEIAKLLLSKGANVDAQTENGEAALHLFAQRGNEEIIMMLLDKGANVNVEQKDGTTPLHIATERGHEQVVKVLLEYGAKVDSKTKDDITPLHLAAQRGYQEIIETILKAGAEINSRDKDGRTALHIASLQGYVKVVETLLEYGSDINITSRNYRTPLDHAKVGITWSFDSDDECNNIDPDRGFSTREVIVEILKCHMVKMETANLYISEENLQSVDWDYKMDDFQNECEEEIKTMKSENINNLNISFYDILAKGTSSSAVYMRNENIVQVLKSGDYKSKYPIYASMIETHFRKAMKRMELLEEANKIFHSLFLAFPELPYDCTEKIFSYLNEEDLKNFNRCLQAS